MVSLLSFRLWSARGRPLFPSTCSSRRSKRCVLRLSSGRRGLGPRRSQRSVRSGPSTTQNSSPSSVRFYKENGQMKQNLLLTIATLLSVLFMTLHLADDIVRGVEPGGLSSLIIVPIVVVLLFGPAVSGKGRSGYVIILLVSLLLLVVPVIHMRGKGVGVANGIAD